MLPDIPKNMPNMEILIREFETGFCSMSTNCCRDTASKASTLSDGNFVKKIVEAYESSVRASNENSQWERAKEKSSFFNTFDVAQNRKNVEKSGSSLTTYDKLSSQCRKNSNEKSEIFSTPFEAHEVKDDFVIFNRYHSKSDEKTVSEMWTGSSSKINMYSSMGELLMNAQSSPLKRNETWNLKKRDQKLDHRTKNKLMICSSPLEDVEDKDLDCEDPLDDILTSSCDSSSNNSYRNLQADLYDFEDEQWQPEFSSTSLSSSSGSRNNINSDDGLLLNSSFQDVIVPSSKDTLKSRENLDSESSPSSNFDRKSSQTIAASLNDDRLIDNDTRVTWMSTLGGKLSRKRPLKKLLKSAFNTKLLNYKNIWKKSAEKQPNECTSDSGFIERFLSSSSSSSSPKSWRSDPDEKPSILPTFATFGRAKNACVSGKTWSKSSRMILTEVPREEFTSDSKPSDSTLWVPCSTIYRKEDHRIVESSLKSTILSSSSKLEASCGYPPLPKHPYLTRNGIPKHPFVAKTKLDQEAEEEEMEEEEMRCDAKERESDARELESLYTSPVSNAELDLSYSRMSEKWLVSSPNKNCDLLR